MRGTRWTYWAAATEMLTPFNNANNSPENFNEPMGDLAMQMPGGYTPASPNKILFNTGSEWQDDINGLADFYYTSYRGERINIRTRLMQIKS